MTVLVISISAAADQGAAPSGTGTGEGPAAAGTADFEVARTGHNGHDSVVALPIIIHDRTWIYGWTLSAELDWRTPQDQFAVFQGIHFGAPAVLGFTHFWGGQDRVAHASVDEESVQLTLRERASGSWLLVATVNTNLFPLEPGTHWFLVAAPGIDDLDLDLSIAHDNPGNLTFGSAADVVTTDTASTFDLRGFEGSAGAAGGRFAAVGDIQAGRALQREVTGSGRVVADWHVEPGIGTFHLRTRGADTEIVETRTSTDPLADREEHIDGAAATALSPFDLELRHGAMVTLYDHAFRFLTFSVPLPES